MGRFLESEKLHQMEFKASSAHFSQGARVDGVYKHKFRPFCLPLAYADENLQSEIRQPALQFFADHSIKWHDGHNRKPSNHLCDSQVSCVNFLFPFANKPDALASLLHPYFPTLRAMLPMESDSYVTFEWIGRENYLHEKIWRNGIRTRGANFTSADAAVRFEHCDGRQQIVLIEWKYTEAYGSTSLAIAKSGTDRREIYRWLYDRDDFPLQKELLPSFDALFHEPFYQLMRQQLLARQMELAGELGADIVSVLHIAPAHNTDFRKVTSPELNNLGNSLGYSPTTIWSGLQRDPSRFLSVDTETLFGLPDVLQHPGMRDWSHYICERYRWVVADHHPTNASQSRRPR